MLERTHLTYFPDLLEKHPFNPPTLPGVERVRLQHQSSNPSVSQSASQASPASQPACQASQPRQTASPVVSWPAVSKHTDSEYCALVKAGEGGRRPPKPVESWRRGAASPAQAASLTTSAQSANPAQQAAAGCSITKGSQNGIWHKSDNFPPLPEVFAVQKNRNTS